MPDGTYPSNLVFKSSIVHLLLENCAEVVEMGLAHRSKLMAAPDTKFDQDLPGFP